MVATSDHMIRLGRDKTFDANAVIHDPVQLTSMLQELVTRINFRHVRGFQPMQFILESNWSDEEMEINDLIQIKTNPNRWNLDQLSKTNHRRHYLKLFDSGVPRWSEVYSKDSRFKKDGCAFVRRLWLIDRDGKLYECTARHDSDFRVNREKKMWQRHFVIATALMTECKWDDKKLLEEISSQPAENRAINAVEVIQSATIDTMSAINEQLIKIVDYQKIITGVTASLIEAAFDETVNQFEETEQKRVLDS